MEKALKIIPQSDREIVMTRVFNAPRELVFDAYTKPELVKRCLGAFGGWTLPICACATSRAKPPMRCSSPRWRAESRRATTSLPNCSRPARSGERDDDRSERPPPLFLLASAYRVVYGVATSWLVARLAPGHPMKHALSFGSSASS
jgi:hypothetical protein